MAAMSGAAAILVPGKWNLEGEEFKAILGYIESSKPVWAM